MKKCSHSWSRSTCICDFIDESSFADGGADANDANDDENSKIPLLFKRQKSLVWP